MDRLLLFLLFTLIQNTLYSQKLLCPQSEKVDQLIAKAVNLNKKGKSNEVLPALKEAITESKIEKCKIGELEAWKNIMLFHGRQSNYNSCIEASIEVEKLAKELKDYLILSRAFRTRAIMYDLIGLYDKSLQEYENSIQYSKLIADTDQSHYNLSLTYYNMAPHYQDESLEETLFYLLKSKEEIEKVSNDNTTVTEDNKTDMLVSININLGIFYYDQDYALMNLTLSEKYLLEALSLIENTMSKIDQRTNIDLFTSLGKLYLEKKEYEKSIQYLDEALEMERKSNMIYNRRIAYMVISKAYLGLEDSKSSKKYLHLFSTLNDSINNAEKKAVEMPIKKMIKQSDSANQKKLKNIIIIVALCVFLLSISGYILWKRKEKIYLEKYQDLLQKLEEHKTDGIENTDSEIATKPIQIADDTISILLSKLEKFEKSNKYLKPEVNLSYLTNHLSTNSKYLSEIIKQHKDKSFSQYINDLRIDYIIKQLYENSEYRKYKISYLAKISGFSSREVFTVAFKKKTGISPSFFIQNLSQPE